MPLRKIKVLIVDDSLVFCRFLSQSLPAGNQQIEVVGYAMNAYDALMKIPKLSPDVITMDVEMPRMNGIDFLKELLPKYPLPVILVSSLNVGVFDALSYGAVDFVKKPDMTKNYTTQTFVNNLAAKIIIASQARIRIPSPPAPVHTTERLHPVHLSSVNDKIIAIGASTGGTEATLQIMKELPANIPGIVITQHMPEGFTKMYAERLNRLCKMEVREAVNGDKIRPGLALIAPGGDLQTKITRIGNMYSVMCYPGDKVNGHRPSVDVLFHSMASTAKSNGVGIILTGMGGDGAEGLLAMKKSGAHTIGQDKDSCVVYGMPKVAYDLGAVAVQAPCSQIAHRLMNYLNAL